jgi:hypothetical protein
MKRPLVLLALALLVVPAAVACAAEMEHQHMAKASPVLDPLKKLEGTWVGKAGPAEQQMDATVVYKVTAAGSAVMETLFPGTPMEMVTMYTAEKGDLVLTHYCAAGNQPRMKARKGGPANELVFEFTGGANIVPAKDQFMHDARLVFVDDDHLRSEWTDWNGGKPAKTMVFEMARQK